MNIYEEINFEIDKIMYGEGRFLSEIIIRKDVYFQFIKEDPVSEEWQKTLYLTNTPTTYLGITLTIVQDLGDIKWILKR